MGSAMPIIYFLVFLQIVLNYFVDKFQLFHFFIKPLQTTLKISKTIIWIIMTFIFIHFLISFWIIASPEVSGKNYAIMIDLPLTEAGGGYLYQIIKRISTMSGLVFAILAFITLVILFFRYYYLLTSTSNINNILYN